MLAVLGVLDKLLVRFRVVVGLKYQDGAVKMMGVVLGVARVRTSNPRYPLRSWTHKTSVSVSGSMVTLSCRVRLIGMVLMSW